MPFFERLIPQRGRLFRRRMQLTTDGTVFLSLLFAMALAAVNTGNNLLYLLLAAMLSLLIVSGVLSEQALAGLTVSRRCPTGVFVNQSAPTVLTLTNSKRRLASYSLHVAHVMEGREERLTGVVGCLPAQGIVQLRSSLCFTRRGVHRVEGVSVRTRFPFGLVTKTLYLPLKGEVMVYPEVRQVPWCLAEQFSAIGRDRASSRRGQGLALYNLRLYHPGDSARSMHWKTTARRNELMVQETEVETERRVTIAVWTWLPGGYENDVLMPRRVPVEFEQVVSIAASLVVAMLARGFEVQVSLGEKDISYGSGPAHRERVLRELALVSPACEAGLSGARRMGAGARRFRRDEGPTFVVCPMSQVDCMQDVWARPAQVILSSEWESWKSPDIL